jgi:hypothetical protein
MKFIFFLIILMSCSNSSILHKTLDRELISFNIVSNKIHPYTLRNFLELSDEKPEDKDQLVFNSPVSILEEQGKELLYTKEVIFADVLNQNVDIDMEFKIKNNWYERNKKSINFIYGITILFITFVTIKAN